ncbi:MAG: hypothetical protein QXE78_08350 [Nitrososphaeria archaeon]
MILLFGGPDGCGKTTIAKLVIRNLKRKGYPVTYVWLRYPRFLSLLPLLLSKMLGLTVEYKIGDSCKHKYHDFKRSPTLGVLYELTLVLDYALYKFIKVTIPNFIGYLVVIDRYLIDIAVDLLVERGTLTRFTLAYLSKESSQLGLKVIILADVKLLLQRRKDNKCNPHLKMVISLYKYLSKIYGIPNSQNNRPEDLSGIVSKLTGSFNSIRIYASVSSQLVKALFLKHKNLIYLSNFIFQGMGYMWKLELFFRLLIQVLMIILLHTYLKINILLAVLVSHAILYLPYNNIYALRKWIKEGQPNPWKITEGLRKLAIVEKKYQSCINVYIVGSLAQDPTLMFKSQVDIDARVVSNKGIKCVLVSILISHYLRTWSLTRKVPLDLYVKPIKDSEFQKKNYVRCKIILEKLSARSK